MISEKKDSINVDDVILVKIEKMIFGGAGLARLNDNDGAKGAVVFVRYAAPGDELRVKITVKKKNFYEAEIVEIVKASEHRQSPPCEYYQICGGCNWQHLKYQEQLRQKQNIILEQLRPVINNQTKVFDIIPSPKEFRYRNRIQLKFSAPNLGYHQRGTHQIVNIKDCLIAEESVAEKIAPLRKSLIQQNSPPLKVIELRQQDTRNEEELNFSQVNSLQNENLTQLALKWMTDNSNPYSQPKYWDLYCGNGNFSFPLLQLLKANKQTPASIVGVELSESSVAEAQKKLTENGIDFQQLQFFCADVEVFLRRHTPPTGAVVLLDPPRAGASEYILKSLANSNISKIVYISCDPAALRRDLQRLLEYNSAWQLTRLQAFDMFPQTDHIETMVELKRNHS